jgi:hypothetical protein
MLVERSQNVLRRRPGRRRGQPHGESRAPPGLAGGRDGAAVALDDLPGQREPDAEPLAGAGGPPDEPVEHRAGPRRIEADTGVRDDQLHRAAAVDGRNGDRDASLRWRVPDGVVQQRRHHPPQGGHDPRHHERPRSHLEFRGQAALVQTPRLRGEQVGGDRGEVDPLVSGGVRSQPRAAQHVVEHLAEFAGARHHPAQLGRERLGQFVGSPQKELAAHVQARERCPQLVARVGDEAGAPVQQFGHRVQHPPGHQAADGDRHDQPHQQAGHPADEQDHATDRRSDTRRHHQSGPAQEAPFPVLGRCAHRAPIW